MKQQKDIYQLEVSEKIYPALFYGVKSDPEV